MAPVEIDHVPRSIIAPVKNMKVMDKAMSLPLVSSAYSEVTRVTSPYMESTYNKVSPVVENTLEMVSQVVDSVKTKMEEQVLPHIPSKITETVQTYQEAAVDQVIAVVEKVCTFIHLKLVYQMCNFRLIPSLVEELTSSLKRSPSSRTPLLSSSRRPR